MGGVAKFPQPEAIDRCVRVCMHVFICIENVYFLINSVLVKVKLFLLIYNFFS